MRKFLEFSFHPILLAIYPILALFNFNDAFLNTSLIIRSIILSLILAALIWLLLRWLTKDWQISALIASLFLILFFVYGHVFNLLQARFGDAVRHRFGAVLVLLALALGISLIWRNRENAQEMTRRLNILTLTLMALALFTLASNSFASYQANVAARKNSQEIVTIGDLSIAVEDLPDIYYIILDAYGRSDIIKEFTGGYDNSEFIQELESLGFYVAHCSQTNYSNTTQSLSSSLYLDYLDNIVSEGIALPSWRDSVVRKTLDSLGYTTYSFESRAAGHYDLSPDILLSRNSILMGEFSISGGINDFESLLMNTSLLRLLANAPFLSARLAFLQNPTSSGFYEHYLQTMYILDELPKLTELDGPKFVMAHMIMPHRPYIFTPTGDYDGSDPDAHVPGYQRNIEFLNSIMGSILQTIIEKSVVPPIIVLQGDHGPTGDPIPEQRMPILNAYYLSEQSQADLYPSISPVNSFRLIFNNYLGTDYPLIEDISYYLVTRGDFWNADVIPNTCLDKIG